VSKADLAVMNRIVEDAERALVEAAQSYFVYCGVHQFRELKKRMHAYELAVLDETEVRGKAMDFPEPNPIVQALGG
jgi:hypothetical protein